MEEVRRSENFLSYFVAPSTRLVRLIPEPSPPPPPPSLVLPPPDQKIGRAPGDMTSPQGLDAIEAAQVRARIFFSCPFDLFCFVLVFCVFILVLCGPLGFLVRFVHTHSLRTYLVCSYLVSGTHARTYVRTLVSDFTFFFFSFETNGLLFFFFSLIYINLFLF